MYVPIKRGNVSHITVNKCLSDDDFVMALDELIHLEDNVIVIHKDGTVDAIECSTNTINPGDRDFDEVSYGEKLALGLLCKLNDKEFKDSCVLDMDQRAQAMGLPEQ